MELKPKLLVRYFLRGLLLVAPTFLTAYLIWAAVRWLDGLLPIAIPGLGLIIILASITFLGFLGSTFLAKPLFGTLEKLVLRVPLINIVYTSLTDLFQAFMGDKKKFGKPVLVNFGGGTHLYKLGFVTKDDMNELGLPGMVSVYLPHSYNFSGNHFLIEKQYVTPVEVSSVEIMKFIISGGVSKIDLKPQEKSEKL